MTLEVFLQVASKNENKQGQTREHVHNTFFIIYELAPLARVFYPVISNLI